MSTTRKVAYNTATQVAGNFVVSLIAVITLRLLSGYLGATEYGYLVTITAFLGLFSTITDLGLSTIAGREIAKEPSSAERVIGLNLGLRFALSLALLPMVIVTGYLFYHNNNPLILGGLMVLSLTMVIGSIQSSVSAIFVAKVRNDLTALIAVSSKILSLIGILLVIHFGLGYYGYVWLLVVVGIFATILAVILAKRFVRLWPIFNYPEWKSLLLLSLPLGIIQIINMVYLYVDSVLLSLLRPAAEVGYYGIAYSVVTFVMMIPGYFMLALIPSMATADTERLKRVSQKAFDFLVVLAIPFLVGALLLGPYIVVSISNVGFLPAVPALSILMVGAAASYVSAVYGNAIVAIGKEKKLLRLGVYVMLCNLILNLILIPRYGIVGSATATSATEVFAMIYVGWLFYSITGIRNKLTQVARALVAAVAMLAAWVPLSQITYLQSQGPIQLIIITALLGICYGIVLMLIGGLPLNTIKELVGRKS